MATRNPLFIGTCATVLALAIGGAHAAELPAGTVISAEKERIKELEAGVRAERARATVWKVAAVLGWPALTFAKKIEISGSDVKIQRQTEADRHDEEQVGLGAHAAQRARQQPGRRPLQRQPTPEPQPFHVVPFWFDH